MKWVLLGGITLIFFLAFLLMDFIPWHAKFIHMLLFFLIQSFVLIRIDSLTPPKWQPHIAIVKIVLRFLSALLFITYLMFTQDDLNQLVLQFIMLYLVYMLFEIGMSLTNLRRN